VKIINKRCLRQVKLKNLLSHDILPAAAYASFQPVPWDPEICRTEIDVILYRIK